MTESVRERAARHARQAVAAKQAQRIAEEAAARDLVSQTNLAAFRARDGVLAAEAAANVEPSPEDQFESAFAEATELEQARQSELDRVARYQAELDAGV